MTDSKSPAPVGHTPGPWEAVQSIPQYGSECFFIRVAREFGPLTRGFLVEDVATVNGPQWAEQEANAHLIAAAPDLLAACKEAANALAYCAEPATGSDDGRHIADALASLEAAITKAEESKP